MLLLFPVVSSRQWSVQCWYWFRWQDLASWLDTWLSLGHVEREEGCRPSRQRAEWSTDGRGRLCEDQISL